MLRQNTTPMTVPISVPVTPTNAPHIRKMRITAKLSGANGAQHGDVARLVLHHHDQRRDHVEGGDQHDHAEDDEHGVLLHLQHADDGVVGVPPVAQPHLASVEHLAQRWQQRIDIVRLRDADLDAGDRVRLLEEDLRRGKRHEHDAVVVVVQPGVEHRHDLVGAHARDRAECGGRALRRDHRQRIADAQAIELGQTGPDSDRIVTLEVVQLAGQDMVADRMQRRADRPA